MNSFCPICKSKNLLKMVLSNFRSLTTDGKILAKPLVKHQCLDCALFFNKEGYKLESYLRSSGQGITDLERHKIVGEGIFELIKRYFPFKIEELNILEIGGGNYQTSYHLSTFDPKFRVTCLEPFPETKERPENVNCVNHFLEDFKTQTKFDVIFNNQVIEHTNSPADFLALISELLGEKSFAIICCPTQSVISTETLFVDHLFHFSEESFSLLSKKAGLALIDEFVSPWDPLTHCYILSKEQKNKTSIENSLSASAAFEKRKSLINWYNNLDYHLLKMQKENNLANYLFGAGEFAQILECFAPKFFSKIDSILVTSKIGNRSFEKPIKLIDRVEINSGKLFLAVREKIVTDVEKILVSAGWDPKNIINLYIIP